MQYYVNKTLDEDFDEVVKKITNALKEEGFGVLSDIDMQGTLKKKIDVNVRKYRILGACNPSNAYRAVSTEPYIGLMLPCNVVVQETEDGKTDVAAVDPKASMMAVENPELQKVAKDIGEMLTRAVNSV